MRLRRLLLAALLAGAAVPALAREWYDAYQAGLRALARGQAQEAVFLLGEAIAQHPEPGRNLRTYGTNVEPRYFPYLRLAEAYLALDSADGARAALERSAHYGLEPAGERVLLAARTQALLARAMAASPPPTTSPAPPAQMAGPPTTSPAPPVPVAGSVTASEHVPHPAPSSAPSPIATPAAQPSLAPMRPAPRSSLPPPAPASVPAASPSPSPLPVSSPEVDQPAVAKVPGPVQAEARAAVDWMAAGAGALILAVAVLAFVKLRRPRPRDPTDDPTRDLPRSSGAGPLPATPADLPLPARFGDWMLTERLGRGGMATVYRAQRGSEVRALKRPRAAVLEDPQFLERFLREADIGRTLHHPNIVRIHERGEVAGLPFFTMELVAGETLQALLSRPARLPVAEAVRLLRQVVEALDYAHSKGVVHRDLKPSNIMVASDGTARVMDFGIARSQRLEGITVTGAFLGTPEYVAPEAVEGRDVGPRSDLYSLGAIFFEMLTGRRPFEADSPFGVLQKHCTEPPPAPRTLAPDVPPELEAIALRLLAKAPADRFASAEDLLLALRAWLDRAG